jgi:hypothetical protein
MADEDLVDDDEDLPQNAGGALATFMTQSNTTTPEAQQYAKKILDQIGNGPSKEESGILSSLQQKAATNREILRKAREQLSQQKYPTSAGWLRASAALGAPTRTGAFGETAGNLSSALIPFVEGQQKFKQDQAKQLLDLDLAGSGTDDELAKAKLDLLKNRLSASGRLNVEALRTLGRSTAKTASGRTMSNFEKIARGELGPNADEAAVQSRVHQLAEIDIKNKKAQAGVDSEEMSPADKHALAMENGIPLPQVDPYITLSTKAKQQARAIDQRNSEKSLAALDDQSVAARKGLSEADRFLELNKHQPSGFLAGHLPAMSKEAAEMDAITAELSRKMRSPGEGSTSDFDAKQFIAGTFGRGKPFSANESIATAFKVQQQNTLERQNFMQNYFAVNGHLRGAQALWNKYLADNPIFDPDPTKKGTYALNAARKDYQTYFREMMSKPTHKAEGGRVEYADGGSVEESDIPGALRTVGQGATLGLEDELEGMVSSDPDATKNSRASVLKTQQESPVSSMALQTTGTALLIRGIQIARSMGLTDVAIRMIPKSELLRMAMSGGMAGGLSGFNASEGDNRPLGGVAGTIMGAAAGPLAGMASKYGIIGVGNMINRSPLLNKDPTTRGDIRIMDALERDRGVDPAARMTEATRLKVPTSMGTSGGENLQALGRASIQEGGDEADQLATDAARRMQGSRGRVDDRINQSLKPDEFFSEQDKLTKALYENAKPLYKAAYEAYPAVDSPGFMKIAGTPDGKKAIKMAFRLMRNDGKSIGQEDAMGMVRKPSLEFLDKVKQGFDQLISVEEKDGATTMGRSLRGLRSKLMDDLNAQDLPEYKAARDQYRGDLEVRDALRSGREDFARSTPEEIRRSVKDMSFAERDAFRSGVAQHLFEQINKPAGDFNAAHKIIASPATSEKLSAIFEKPSEYRVFKTALERELEEFAKTKQLASTAGGARLARASNDPSLIGKLGTTLDAMPYRSSMIGNAWNYLRLRPDMSEETADEVAQRLKTSNPKEAGDYLKRLALKASRVKRLKGRAGKAGMAIAALTGAATAPNPEGSNLEETP